MNGFKTPGLFCQAREVGLTLALSSYAAIAQVAPADWSARPPAPGASAPVNVPQPVPRPPPLAVPVTPTGAILDANLLPLRVMGAGVFELANVTIDKRQRSISFSAVINMNQGPMEYFLVTSYGKVHESILRTDTMPHHIHLAMLLLDAEGASKYTLPEASPIGRAVTKANPKTSPSTISIPGKETLSGDRLDCLTQEIYQ